MLVEILFPFDRGIAMILQPGVFVGLLIPRDSDIW